MSVTKITARACIALLVMTNTTAYAQIELSDILKEVPGISELSIEGADIAKQLSDSELEEAIPMSEVQAKHACDFRKKDAKKLDTFDRVKSMAMSKGLKRAEKKLQIESIELPERIVSPCYALVRWDYVDRKSIFWAQKVAVATNKALEALDIDDQIEAERLFKDDADNARVTEEEFSSIRKEIDRGLDLVEKSMNEKEATNDVLLAEASSAMQGALAYGAEIVGWDQRLVEFMSDNSSWSLNRKKRVYAFVEHTKMVGNTFKTTTRVAEAMRASESEELNDNPSIVAARQRAKEEDSAFDAMLAEELDL